MRTNSRTSYRGGLSAILVAVVLAILSLALPTAASARDPTAATVSVPASVSPTAHHPLARDAAAYDSPVRVDEEEREKVESATRLAISPAHAQVRIDEKGKFAALLIDASGIAREVGAKWVAENGTIHPDGRYVPAAFGTWTLRADWASHAATATVEVVPGRISTMSISPEQATVFETAQASFMVTVTDSLGNPAQALSIQWDEPSGIEMTRRDGAEWVFDVQVHKPGRFSIGLIAGDGNRTLRGSFLVVVASTNYVPLVVGLGALVGIVIYLAHRLYIPREEPRPFPRNQPGRGPAQWRPLPPPPPPRFRKT